MPSTPKEYQDKIKPIAQAWETLRPAKTFGGLTLAQFKAKVQACTDARDELDALEKQRTAAQDKRDNADNAAYAAAQLVVNAVKGDPDEGDDGDLYEAMGFVRRSKRKSGLHRGKGGAQDKKT